MLYAVEIMAIIALTVLGYKKILKPYIQKKELDAMTIQLADEYDRIIGKK